MYAGGRFSAALGRVEVGWYAGGLIRVISNDGGLVWAGEMMLGASPTAGGDPM